MKTEGYSNSVTETEALEYKEGDERFTVSAATDFLSKADEERISASGIYPQKRIFRAVHSKKIPPVPDPCERKVYPMRRANPLSRLFFFWLMPLLKVGYRRTLQPNDLWAIDPKMSVESNYRIFDKHLSKYVDEARNKYAKEHPDASWDEVVANAKLKDKVLIKALFWTFKWQYSRSIFYCVLGSMLGTIQPLLMKRIIEAINPANNSIGPGIGYVFASSIVLFTCGVLFNHFLHLSTISGTQAVAVLTKAVISKTLRLSGAARHKWSSGKIMSMLSTDSSRLEFGLAFQPFLFTFFPSLIITVIYLLLTVGPVALVGIGVFLVIVVSFVAVFHIMLKLRVAANTQTDARVTIVKDILNNMRVLKFYAWEDAYEESVKDKRENEIKYVKRMQYLRNFLDAATIAVPSFSAMTIFLVMYRVANDRRTAANMFSTLGAFNALSLQLFFLPIALNTAADCLESTRRIQAFLEAEEVPEGSAEDDVQLPSEKHPSSSSALTLVAASFEWPKYEDEQDNSSESSNSVMKKSEITYSTESLVDLSKSGFRGFHDLNLEIKKGELVFVAGAIGAGKTSLLNALAGLMTKTAGSLNVNGNVLFCGYPWVQNATVRENVTFGSPFDEERYKEVIRACSLRSDLDTFPGGDYTEIGERGITLSGGQKARINLARCVYKESDIYLFDDIFSAVDSRVGSHIMEECIIKRLHNKTRIIATHQIHLAKDASKIIFLDNDGSVEVGTIDELRASNSNFAKLLELSSVTKHDESEPKEKWQPFNLEDAKANTSSKLIKMKSAVSATDSLSMFDVHDDFEARGRLIEAEARGTNGIPFSVYKKYLLAGTNGKEFFMIPLLLILIVVTTFFSLFYSVWLSYWSDYRFSGRSDAFYMGLYFCFVMLNFIVSNCEFTMICYMGLNAAKNLNLKAFHRVLHTPASFIDTTPIGRILNRFTKDTETLDNESTIFLRLVIYQLTRILGVVVLCIVYMPWFAIAVPFLALAYVFIADHFQCSAREVKRLEATERSLVYNSLNEVLGGVDTIKAYHAEERFLKKTDYFYNKMCEASFPLVALQRWVAISIDFVATLFAFIIVLPCITRAVNVSPASVGVLLVYVLGLPSDFNTLLRTMTQLELNMNSAERIIEYATDIPQEAPYRIPELQPPDSWPESADINFSDVSFAYRPGLPLVLHDFSIQIRSGEKIGICGRTGAGKSSILSALYRLVELYKGTITIGGIDISKIGLYDLRSRLSIIPQDPVLFRGTIRKNLDPFSVHTDKELWDALIRSGAVDEADAQDTSPDALRHNKFHLDQPVSEDGGNFSVGERQYIALARTLVRRSKILILDEATSSVDFQTDAKIQALLVSQFADSTVLCIAHRLKTILFYDRILVLDQGRVAGLDTPINLYNENSIFHEMCERSGINADDIINAAA
ncbi:HFR122Cp [Eremothecium sinecaudum]|uniref:HFR122Cp n=1 Tax=Eremothecium sinecaudum TaxID=45286 RepID=A0A109UZX4_9SACH|nr:HFR122Cp [Eremothecium sinecaudum]AMD21977.1 HFR122Cp [Eremothecium sinecaudum]